MPLFYEDPRTHKRVVGSVIVFSRPLDDVDADVARRARPRPGRRRWSRCCWRRIAALAGRARRRAARPAAGGRRRPRRRRATSPRASRSTRTTSWASWPGRWSRCAASSPSSTTRASASSPPRRTSCARRCSRSAGSSSCSRRRTSTRRTGAASSPSCASRSLRMQKLATDLLDLSKLEAGSLELRRERTDLGERRADGRRRVRARRCVAHESHMELRLPPKPRRGRCAIPSASRRSCGSSSTTRSPTRRRGPTWWSRPRAAAIAPGWEWGTSDRVSTGRCCRGSSSRSYHRRRAGLRAWGSRSPASWPSGWTAGWPSTRQPGRTTFTLELPA